MEEDSKKNKIKNSATGLHGAVVETYSDDMAKVLENDTEGGLIKKIIHKEEENELEKKTLSPKSVKNRLFIFSGMALIFFGTALLFFYAFKNINNTVNVQRKATPLIFSDKSVPLDISGLNKDAISQAIFGEINKTDVSVDGVEGIYPTENNQIIGLRRFISLIGSSFVPGDNTSFVSDNFLLGAVVTGGESSTPSPVFFLLLKMRSPSDIFDAMRAWEPTMLNDLDGFLGSNPSGDNSYLLKQNFTDGIVENKNARILYDNAGNIVLMYIFADNNSIVITSSPEAAHEIMLRLSSVQ